MWGARARHCDPPTGPSVMPRQAMPVRGGIAHRAVMERQGERVLWQRSVVPCRVAAEALLSALGAVSPILCGVLLLLLLLRLVELLLLSLLWRLPLLLRLLLRLLALLGSLSVSVRAVGCLVAVTLADVAGLAVPRQVPLHDKQHIAGQKCVMSC